MAPRKPFLLRLDPGLFDALQRWANDDVRSLNGQIEFLLTRALREAGRERNPGRPQRRPALAERHDVAGAGRHDTGEAGRQEPRDQSSKR